MMPQAMYDAASPGSATPPSPGPTSLSADELFHTLQNERRRLAIRYLLDRSGPIDVPALVDQVAAWELQTSVEELPDDQRQRIYVDLYQSQLPKLDAQGFVDYDQSDGVVEPAAALQAIDPSLLGGSVGEPPASATDDASEAWLSYYALATAVSVLLVGIATFGPLPEVPISFGIVAIVVTALHATVTAGLFVDRTF